MIIGWLCLWSSLSSNTLNITQHGNWHTLCDSLHQADDRHAGTRQMHAGVPTVPLQSHNKNAAAAANLIDEKSKLYCRLWIASRHSR